MKRAKGNTRTVLISVAQFEAIEKIQDKERQRSGVGACPTLNAIVRGLMDKALKEIGSNEQPKEA